MYWFNNDYDQLVFEQVCIFYDWLYWSEHHVLYSVHRLVASIAWVLGAVVVSDNHCRLHNESSANIRENSLLLRRWDIFVNARMPQNRGKCKTLEWRNKVIFLIPVPLFVQEKLVRSASNQTGRNRNSSSVNIIVLTLGIYISINWNYF